MGSHTPQIRERLDFVAKRIPGLKVLQVSENNKHSCIMGCDTYYIEIRFDQSMQSVEDVIVRHESNTDHSPCPVLKKALVDQDYETFAKHLAGLHSIYSISTNDKKVKQKAYPTLIALETDLSILYDHQRRRINNCHDLVHKSPLGVMEPRRGGFPVKLTYFITPYDLVDMSTRKGLINLTEKNIIDKNLGLSATVEIEGSSAHKLQIKPLISTQQNSSLPQYAPFNSQNSEKLPAQFVLKLSQPFPMLNTSITNIVNEISEPTTIKEYLTTIASNSKESLISLIARQELDLNKGPFCRSVDTLKTNSDLSDAQKHIYTVKLLDQYHTYHILDNYLERQDGVYVTKIPFTHPTSIPTIMKILRQQALFNFVVGSCIRRGSSNGGNNTNNASNNNSLEENSISKVTNESDIFDVIPVNLSSVCISFEHPSKESLATLEIDFKELSCQLHALDMESVCSNEYATKVLQKCWSIPITLRSVLKKCNETRLALLEDANKRREQGLQALLANNSNQQVEANFQSQRPFQEARLQSKFNNVSEKSTSRDLNSIAEFLTSKLSSASTSSNTVSVENTADSKSNSFKKFSISCQPKAKQGTSTKGQSVSSKILSSMLKRPEPISSSPEEAKLKSAAKKVKTKVNQDCGSKGFTAGVSATKLISSEAAAAARLANKQAKQNVSGQNPSVSLIRSPNKFNQSQGNANSNVAVGVSLTPQNASQNFKNLDGTPIGGNSINVRVKGQANGANNNGGNATNNATNKPRKSSINAVLDRLVGGLTPAEQNSPILFQNDNSDSSVKNLDSPKNSSQGSKSKSRVAPSDQFAIKQGSLGGLKLTVTKTKPASPSVAGSSVSTAAVASSASASNPANSSAKADASQILGLGTSAPTIKYTIPKISKTQQASQSGSNPANSTENSNSSGSDTQADESANPSSTANSNSATSSTTSKRTSSTPFNRPNNSNRNPVSSSTHPPGRTTSNPLPAASRPSSSSGSNDSHTANRISSSNQNMRQQTMNRIVNLQASGQRLLNNNNNGGNLIQGMQQQQSIVNQAPPMFALGLNQQPGPFQNVADLNLIAANQAALLNQQRSQQQQAALNQINNQMPLPPPFMSSSVESNLISSSKPQFATGMPHPINAIPTNNSSVGDSLQRPSPSVINAPPQFYVRQPMFEDVSNAVSSTPIIPTNEVSQSSTERKIPLEATLQPSLQIAATSLGSSSTSSTSIGFQSSSSSSARNVNEMSSTTTTTNIKTLLGNQGVSSSSDSGAEPIISTPSSPTECNQVDAVQPPPLIPIDSLEEPQVISPDTDHPDDASDRLSIVDASENVADSNSAAGTPKPSISSSPLAILDANPSGSASSSTPASSSVSGSVGNSSTSAGPSSAVDHVAGGSAEVSAMENHSESVMSSSLAQSSSEVPVTAAIQSPPASTSGGAMVGSTPQQPTVEQQASIVMTSSTSEDTTSSTAATAAIPTTSSAQQQPNRLSPSIGSSRIVAPSDDNMGNQV